MVRQTHRVLTLLLLLCIAAFCGSLRAQTEKTITLRMLDSKTEKLIPTSHFLVRVNHDKTIHADWVELNENGTGKLTLPKGATLLSIQATYDSAMEIYVNCDAATGSAKLTDRWYAVSEILSLGIAVPNSCVKPKDAAKAKPVAKPGEFVFFVREHSRREQTQEDFSPQ
jgi:hypothetical protein